MNSKGREYYLELLTRSLNSDSELVLEQNDANWTAVSFEVSPLLPPRRALLSSEQRHELDDRASLTCSLQVGPLAPPSRALLSQEKSAGRRHIWLSAPPWLRF